MRSARNHLVTKTTRVLSAVAISAIGFSALTFSPASATSSAKLSCHARVIDNHMDMYGFVTVNVLTRPQAEVSATESTGTRSWPMTPTSFANASGIARLVQRVSTVAKVELVNVDVHVVLNG